MAFLANQQQQQQSSNSNTPELTRSSSSNELLGLHQQLLASMQHNGLNGPGSPLQVSAGNSNTTQQLYQLLLSQKLQQSQALHISPVSEPASSQPSPNDLVQQLAQTLLVNPTMNSVTPQNSMVCSPTQQSVLGQDLAFQGLLTTQPSLLASVLNAQTQARQSLQPNLVALLQQQQAQRAAQTAQPNHAAILQLMQTNPLLASQILAQQQSCEPNQTLSLLTQLAQQQQEQASPPAMESLSKSQTTYDEILKRQQESQQNIAAAIAAVQQKQPRLTSQSSSSSLFSNPCTDGPNTSTPTSSTPIDISTPKPPHPSTVRQASSERLLSGAESVQDHISRLISENEAIVEPNPVLLKRRPYHRQSTSNSITSQTSEAVGPPSQRESPGLFHNVPNHRLPTTRSQSMHESQMLQHVHRMNNGSLTSGQPRSTQQPATATTTTSSCNFCNLKFPNEAGLKAHEFRCSKKEQLQKRLLLQKQKSQPQLQQWHSTALLNAQQQQLLLLHQQQIQQQQKLLAQQQHQSTIAALVGGGAGVAPELFANNIFGGRNSVPISSSPGPSRVQNVATSSTAAPSPPLGSKNGTSSPSTSSTCSENRHPLKKRLLESVARHSSDMDLNHRSPGTPTSACSSMDTSEAQQSPAKMAKMDTTLLELLQLNADRPVDEVINELLNSTKKTPQIMPDGILYANSYIEARISLKMPYSVTLDPNTIHFDKDEDNPWLLLRKARNVTYDRNAIETTVFSHEEMTAGASNYALIGIQPIISADEEKHLLQVLRHSPNEPKLLHYSQSQAVTYRTTHSSYWKAFEGKAVTNTTNALPTPISVAVEEVRKSPSPMLSPKSPLESPKEPITQLDLKIDGCESPLKTLEKIEKLDLKPIGKLRPEEVEVYVRGRGRGRYVCERCGIRCKKPSMLKKHLKSHTNIRPFSCITCNFAFKTKGNLTKHLFSKTHRVKVANTRGEAQIIDGEENTYRNYNPESEFDSNAMKLSMLESRFVNDEFDNKNDDNDSENEDEIDFSAPLPPCSAAIPYRRFGQENILFERTAHTPPTLWTLYPSDVSTQWPKPDDPERSCHSAPPACSSTPPKRSEKKAIEVKEVEPAPATAEFNFTPILNNFQLNRPIEMEDAERVLALKNLPISSAAAISKILNLAELNRQNVLYPLDNLKQISNTSVGEFLATECRSFYCEMCDRKFRKESELNLHKQTHLIEQQNARTRAYQCLECRTVHRSKALLVKHMELAHNKTIDQGEDRVEEVSTDVAETSTTGNNLRRYWCSDCDVGFRTHGVLIKHLRSKNHVKTLASQGKIPEDALSLIKDHSSQLAQIDATDCVQAKRTILQLLEELRAETKTATPETSIGISEQSLTLVQEAVRKRSEVSESQDVKPTVSLLKKPDAKLSELPLFSFNVGKPALQNGSTIVNNVWLPPKADQVKENPPTKTVEHHEPASVRSNEESESTSRSASSTPVQRQTNISVNCTPLSPNSASNTRCNICEVNFDSGVYLQVHYLADHCARRDGKDYRCLQKNCEKVFNSKHTLKNHVFTHFSTATPPNQVQEKTPERPHKRSVNGTPESLIGIADWRQSKKIKTEETSKTTPTEVTIPCHMCGQTFKDTLVLQKHWVENHLAQLDSRPHVCQRCDAGFTTIDALRLHAASHT
ncbi:unnamed protein product [Bursaphelenchus xylophilus]|uniref:(pine wood nematode) hypothetical protein n=1 Tax=Bursaphelenchus xylophilus TaxID=6326 RepID=A0A1I7S9Q9_BURXY|nr:unnamed protein product [Bursaphelenchus xylophilus]CAG9129178.1 unnamed protein product [Bursaphelenchus xylophilus]